MIKVSPSFLFPTGQRMAAVTKMLQRSSLIILVIFLFAGYAFAQCPAPYTLSATTHSVNATTGTWTAPATGGPYRIKITAAGAKGGSTFSYLNGGSGAIVVGDFIVNSGVTLYVAAGAPGADAPYNGNSTGGSGGGAGSGVYIQNGVTKSILILAGGGGGAGANQYNGAAGGGNISTAGSNGGNSGGTGGTSGGGGTGGNPGGGGGGGYLSAGSDGTTNTSSDGVGTGGGTSVGGTIGGTGFIGGNGGGGLGAGGAGGNGYNPAGGGGGGYSGGGGGSNCGGNCTAGGGGGGGSYNTGTNQTNTAGANAGGGYVTIECLGPVPAISINDVTQNEGNVGSTIFTFTVSLSIPAGAGGVNFDIATANNTATTANNDYAAKSLTSQTIPAGNSTYSFTVTANGDVAVEPNETFFVNVTNVSGATVSDGQGLGAITNDDCGAGTQTFNYTGDVQDFVIPFGINRITLAVTGADGGDFSTNTLGGSGGVVNATFPVLSGDHIRVTVGGAGKDFPSGSGAGGTAVINCGNPANCATGTLLVVAGGGGGGYNNVGGGASSVIGSGAGGTGGTGAGGGGGVNGAGDGVGNGGGQALKTAISAGGLDYAPGGKGFGGGGGADRGAGGGGGYTGGNAASSSSSTGGSNFVDASALAGFTNNAGVTGGSGGDNTDGVVVLSYSCPIPGPTASVLSVNALSTICKGTSTNLIVTITGGTSPYTVVYSDGTNNFTVNNYTSGTDIPVSPTVYTTYSLVSVTDAASIAGTGNSGIPAITITDPPTWYLDADGDTYYVSSVASCTSPGAGYTTTGGTLGDCDDANKDVWRSASLYIDADGDGYDAGTATVCYGATIPSGYKATTLGSDCNDGNRDVHATGNFYVDGDGDTYGIGSLQPVCYSGTGTPVGYSTNNTDCNDNDASIHAKVQYYVDADLDGFGSTTTAMLCSLTAPVGYATNNTDCNDGDAAVHSLQTYYRDADGDGYGSSVITSVCASIPPTGYTTRTGDCNDNNPAINPGAVEVCGNNIDDNCNGLVDEQACFPCKNATNFTTTNITATSATLNWTALANPVQWQVQYKTTSSGSKWIDVFPTGNRRSVVISSLLPNQNYIWHIRAKCGNIWTEYSISIGFKTLAVGAGSVTTTSSLKQPLSSEEMPGELTVQNYPNPFSRVTTIRYQLPTAAQVSVIVYNQNGQKVAVLANGKQTAGTHQVIFNAGKLSAGLYNYQLQTIDANGKLQSFSGKMIMMK